MAKAQTTQQYQNLNKKLFVIETWTVEQVINWAKGKTINVDILDRYLFTNA